MKSHSKTININEIEIIDKLAHAMIFKQGEAFANSTQIAKYFSIRHDDLLKKIRAYNGFDDLIKFGKISELKRRYRGRDFPYFELDADSFAFICLGINTQKGEKFKWAFIEAYKRANIEVAVLKAKAEQNKANHQWIEARNTNKKKHISLTDAVKALCENAESQRGYPYSVDEDGEPTNKPCPYYALIQNNIIYKKLGIDTSKKCIKKGDTLTGLEIEAVTAFEEDIAVKIMELLETKKHYKKIYKALKKLEPKVSLLWLNWMMVTK